MNKKGIAGWTPLTLEEQIDEIAIQSFQTPVLIYKHSTRCATSFLVWQRLERQRKTHPDGLFPAFFLDLIANRTISDKIAWRFRIEHESPQVILIYQGKSVYNASHLAIDYPSIVRHVNPVS